MAIKTKYTEEKSFAETSPLISVLNSLAEKGAVMRVPQTTDGQTQYLVNGSTLVVLTYQPTAPRGKEVRHDWMSVNNNDYQSARELVNAELSKPGAPTVHDYHQD